MEKSKPMEEAVEEGLVGWEVVDSVWKGYIVVAEGWRGTEVLEGV